jgi:hypothetical protein
MGSAADFEKASRLKQAGKKFKLGGTPYKRSRNFPCPYAVQHDCTRMFGSTQKATEHDEIHTGERPFKVSNMPLEAQDVGTLKYTLGDLLG